MPTAIDGSNLGGFLGGRAGSRDAASVLRRLLPFSRGRRTATVVFDGPEESLLARGYGSLRVVFSGSRSADRVILELVSERPRNWTVVTNDGELTGACRALGARVEKVASFLERLPKESPEETSEAAVDVADWEAWFAAGRED